MKTLVACAFITTMLVSMSASAILPARVGGVDGVNGVAPVGNPGVGTGVYNPAPGVQNPGTAAAAARARTTYPAYGHGQARGWRRGHAVAPRGYRR